MNPPGQEALSPEILRLQAEATYARERYQLYRARAHGSRPTDASRMRALKVAFQRAEARLRRAKSTPSNN
jgi:CRISPR/Cas system-associated protein Csm6